jgi:RNA polymerase sigma-70 factor (ECF subfamily)
MPDALTPDAELVRRARDGDVEAFGELVERNQDQIYNALYHLDGSEHDAEDVAQEVFLKAYGAISGFRGDAKFSTWLYGIMLNTVRNVWRSQKRRNVIRLDERFDDDDQPRPELEADQETPAEAAVRDERVAAVRTAIAELDEELREILVLRDIRGFRYEELADVLGVPRGTVKSRLHRARLALKVKLDPFHSDARLAGDRP